jgi:hypothetical protein
MMKAQNYHLIRALLKKLAPPGLSLLLLLLTGSMLQAQVPLNDIACNATAVNSGRDVAEKIILSNNFGATADSWSSGSSCMDLDHSVYYKYFLPDGYTQLRVILKPDAAKSFSVMFLDPVDCTLPVIYSSSKQCADYDGDTLRTANVGECLGRGGEVLVRVAGAEEGSYKLEFLPIKPSCGDGCSNGFETSVDAIASPIVFNPAGELRTCDGEELELRIAGDSTIWSNIDWSTGESGAGIDVSQIGVYQVDVVDSFGCEASKSVIVRSDTNCVFPGETNLDGQINGLDLIPIGWAYGMNGPSRAGALPIGGITTDLIGVSALDWPLPDTLPGTYGGVNLKHVDSDGNGIIDGMDAMAIGENYGGIVYYREANQRSSSSDPPVFFTFSTDSIELYDTLGVYVHLGDSLNQLTDIYSYRLEVRYDDFQVDSNYFYLDFDSSWIKNDSLTDVSFHYKYPGYVDIAFSRTDGTTVSGYGVVAYFEVVITDDLGIRLSHYSPLNFDFESVDVFDPNLEYVPVSPQADSVTTVKNCDSRGLNSSDQWIEGIRLHTRNFHSGNNGGYHDTIITFGQLRPGMNLPFIVAPGSSSGADTLHWRISADFNLDGEYSQDEYIIDVYDDGLVSGEIQVPIDAELGWTTIRFQAANKATEHIDPCSDLQFGEVEDFIIEIVPNAREASEDEGIHLWVSPNPLLAHKTEWAYIDLASTSKLGAIRVSLLDFQGQSVMRIGSYHIAEKSTRLKFSPRDLEAGLYLLEVKNEQHSSYFKIQVQR